MSDRSYRTADPYRDLDVIDARAPRANQTVVGLVALAGVLTGQWWLLALVAAQLALGLTMGRRWCLACVAYFELLQPRIGEGPLEDSRPPRFANLMGVAVLTPAAIAYLAGLPLLGAVLGLLVAALALLSAATGFCTGCQIYKLAARVRGLGRGHGHIERIEPSDFGERARPQHGRAVHPPALLRLPPAGARAARRGPHRGHGRRAQPAPAGPQVRRGRGAHGRDRGRLGCRPARSPDG